MITIKEAKKEAPRSNPSCLIIYYYHKKEEKMMDEIMKALKALDVTGIVSTKHITIDRIAVYVDGEYFGTWDTNRKTFVD